MQFGGELDESGVVQAECPPQVDCMSVLQAVTMANNVRKEHDDPHKVRYQQRTYGGRKDATIEVRGRLRKQWGRDCS